VAYWAKPIRIPMRPKLLTSQVVICRLDVPGPKSPGDLDSFLHPLVEEMHELERGIEGTDGDDERSFTLRAWISMVTG
jgi:hypothetical protein